MIYNSAEIETRPFPKYGDNCVQFKFKGKFTEEASKQACQAWSGEFNTTDTNKDYVLIWDCLDMGGFDLGAKNEWIKCMNAHESRISKVILVSDNIIIRGAARLILQLFSFEIQVVKSYSEIMVLQVA